MLDTGWVLAKRVDRTGWAQRACDEAKTRWRTGKASPVGSRLEAAAREQLAYGLGIACGIHMDEGDVCPIQRDHSHVPRRVGRPQVVCVAAHACGGHD